MKKTISLMMIAAMLVTTLSLSGVSAQAAGKKRVAIIYFSVTGTTKSVAKKIQKTKKGTLIEIKAAKPYTSSDIDYNNGSSRAAKEHNTAASPLASKVRPKISNIKQICKVVKKASVVYIGYPIWWGEAPHIMYTLVESMNVKGKKVIPFCTSASSGVGESSVNLKKKAKVSKKTKWQAGSSFYDGSTQKKVNQWIKKVEKA